MTDDDLRTALGRAAGTPDDRPALDALWAAGRTRRRRTRALSAAAAVVAVLVLAAGAVAAGRDGHDEVVAGPTEGATEVPAPPPEPTDGPVGIAIVGATAGGDVPLLDPDASFTVDVTGPDGVARSPWFGWEAWDGERWSTVHTLFPGDADGPPQVLGPEVGPTISMTVPLDRVVGPLRAPTAVPGWYRVCTQGSGVQVVPEEPAPVPVAVTACAQVRVPDRDAPADAADGSTSTTIADDVSPPPGWGEDDPTDLEEGSDAVVAYTIGTPPHPAGEFVAVQVPWGGGLTLGAGTTWEQWDGTMWVRTHLAEGVTTGGEPRLVPLIAGDLPEVPATTHVFERDLTNLVVPTPPLAELTSRWSRVCFDAEPSGLGRPCADVDIDGAGGRTPTTHGDEATWEVDPAQPPEIGSRSFGALVTRVGCNSGVTGAVLRAQVEPGIDAHVITIDVEHVEGDATCPGNDAVPVTVELGFPLELSQNGARYLLDGHCRADCSVPPLRWSAP